MIHAMTRFIKYINTGTQFRVYSKHVDRLVLYAWYGEVCSPLATVQRRQGDGGKTNIESKTRADEHPDFELTNQ